MALGVGDQVGSMRIDPHHGHAELYGFRDNLAGAPHSGGRLAIPDGDENVAMMDEQLARRKIGRRSLLARSIDFKDAAGLSQKIVKLLPGIGRDKVLLVFLPRIGERRLQFKAHAQAALRNKAVGALGQRRDHAQASRLLVIDFPFGHAQRSVSHTGEDGIDLRIEQFGVGRGEAAGPVAGNADPHDQSRPRRMRAGCRLRLSAQPFDCLRYLRLAHCVQSFSRGQHSGHK